MRRRIGVSAVILLFLTNISMTARAEEEVLSWADCLKEAKANHPDLIAAQEALKQAKANKAIARSDALPQISSTLSGKTAESAAKVTTDTYAYELTGTQLLFDGFKTANDVASAGEDVKAAQYNYAVTSADIRLSLRTAFTELLKAQELLEITKGIAARRKENLEMVGLRYEAGREHRGSLLSAQANASQAEFEVVQAQRDIALAQRKLTKELGRKELLPIKAKGELETKAPQQQKPDFGLLAESNPTLGDLMAKKGAARFDLKAAQAEFFPSVSASASTGKTDTHWPPRNETWSAGVTLSLPVFEGGSRLAGVSKARAAFNQAQEVERSGRDSVTFTLEEAWKQWQDAADEVTVKQKFLEAAEERARITQSQYSIGLSSFDDWSIIEDNLVSAKKSFLDAKTAALIAEAAWVQAKGGTLDYDEQ